MPREARKECLSLWGCSHSGHQTVWVLGTELSPLERQKVLLIAEPSVQPYEPFLNLGKANIIYIKKILDFFLKSVSPYF